eukprot:TRINITY_DN1900_c0_g1_i1.p1 TRINITY_DN1900_c0_g1~~TRINITY_DN1900_c0_g1_i1.p1  ORF type:complete len:236 (-),score=50.51 TRINITY_DN1900_c0_g1_i1:44-664(-)
MAENKYSSIVQEATKNALALVLENSGWTEKFKDGTTVGSSKAFPPSPIECYRVSGIVNASPSRLADIIWSRTKEDWQIVDDAVVEWEIKQQIDDNTRIVYQVNKLTWPLWSRDLVYVQSRAVQGDTHVIAAKSIQYEPIPEYKDKYVRAELNVSAFVFAPGPEDGKTLASRIIHVDPAGSIPTAVVNATAKKVFKFIDSLNESISD